MFGEDFSILFETKVKVSWMRYRSSIEELRQVLCIVDNAFLLCATLRND